MIYEGLLLIVVVLAGSLPFVMLTHGMYHDHARRLLQLYLVVLTGGYFAWQWRRGGRTLAMKTWRLRLVTREGEALTWKHICKRFLVALPGTLFLGVGFLWALIDREQLFLHDRLTSTKIIKDEGNRNP